MSDIRPRIPRLRPPVLLAAALLAAALPGLAGCATSPATGESFLSFVSEEEEKRIGAEQHPKLVKAFGGEIENAEVKAYVDSIGGKLAKESELPNLGFTFTVLDTSTVNAFALPGGYVYITRGLLALANSEAELAGVIGHEIGHVTARHSTQRYSESVLAQVGVTVFGVLTGSRELTRLAGTGAQLALRSYSREDEFEADMLGVRYLRRAGYDPDAMAGFLRSLRAHSRLEARLMGLEPGKVDEFDLMATHPRTVERVQRAASLSLGLGAANPAVGREAFLRRIDGMIYGDSPAQGFVRGREFRHPELRFRFRVPEGFHLSNSPAQVAARGPEGAIILFDAAEKAGRRSPRDYLVNVWARNLRLSRVEELTVNGLPAASGDARVRTREGARDAKLVAIRADDEHIYRFTFLTPSDRTERLAPGIRDTIHSFRRVDAAEAARWKPWRIRLHTVAAGDTVAGLAARLPFDRLAEERFRVLNGLGPDGTLRVGQTVKLVAE